jgi:hypothetical protein
LLARKLRGPMADWTLEALLLRNVEFGIRGLQWQNSGGKGQKPKPVELPDDKSRTSAPARSSSKPEVIDRLRNLGMIPADAAD